MSLSLLAPLGRVLLAHLFVLAGLSKLLDPAGAAAYIESGGLPGALVWPTIALEIGGGALLAIGFLARPAAAALAVFAVVSGLLFHLVPGLELEGPERTNQIIHFQKNLALAGALLFVTAMGPGPHALSKS